MNILTLFVVIPVLMLIGLWLSKNDNQVRGVMVVGASALLGLAIWLTISFIQLRHAGNTDLMLFTYSVPWCRWNFGCNDIVVSRYCFHGHLCLMAVGTYEERIFLMVCVAKHRCIWLLHFN